MCKYKKIICGPNETYIISQTIDHGTSDEDGPGSKCQGLEDIGATADTTIEVYFAFSLHCVHHLDQGFDLVTTILEQMKNININLPKQELCPVVVHRGWRRECHRTCAREQEEHPPG